MGCPAVLRTKSTVWARPDRYSSRVRGHPRSPTASRKTCSGRARPLLLVAIGDLGPVVLGRSVRAVGPVASAPADVDDVGALHEAIDHGSGQGGVSQDPAPLLHAEVRAEHGGLFQVPGLDQVEQQGGVLGPGGDVAQVVNLCGAQHKSTHVESPVM